MVRSMSDNSESSWQRVLAVRAIVVVAVLSIWEIAGRSSGKVSFVIATPSSAAVEFWNLLTAEGLLNHTLVTGGEAGLGLVIGVSVGSVIGLCFWYSRTTYDALHPIFVVAANAPVFAFAPLLVVWFGIDFGMKVALSFFFTFFAAIVQTHRGATQVAGDWVEVYRTLGGTKRGAFHRVIVPGALDAVLSSFRASVGLALLGAFIGEFIASSKGLGYLVLRASGVFNVPRALGASVAIVALAVLFDRAAGAIENRRAALLQLLGVNSLLWRWKIRNPFR